MLIKKKSGEFCFFSNDLKGLNLLNKIEKKEFIIRRVYKNDSRTYVAKIAVEEKEYLLKVYYPRTTLKKILTCIKGAESLKTLENVTIFRSKGIKELVPCIGSMEKRERGVVVKEALIMEFCEGKKPETKEEFQKVLNVLDKIFNFRRYHGDCNPGNFLVDEKGEIHIIDTKLKKMYFGDYRRHFDFLVLQKYFPEKIKYPYKKNIFYLFALLVRRIRDKKNYYHIKREMKSDTKRK